MRVTRRDPFTSELNTIELPITEEQVMEWYSGELAQNAFPHLTPDQREFIITGIPPGKWEEYMGTGA